MEYRLNEISGVTRGVVNTTSAISAAGGDLSGTHRMRTTPGREARRERRRLQRAKAKGRKRGGTW